MWLPLFTPTGEGGITPLPEDQINASNISGFVRPRIPGPKFEDASAISGIGMSQIGRRLMRDPLSLTVDACTAAIEDAGLTFDDIDGLATYPGGSQSGMGRAASPPSRQPSGSDLRGTTAAQRPSAQVARSSPR